MSSINSCCCRQGRVWPLARPDYDDNVEARGYVACVAARGPIVIYGALFGTVALNAFATVLADCQGNVIGGLKASSVVSTLATVEGVANSLGSPLFGGYADLTPHRKPAFGITFMILVFCLIIQAIVFLPGEGDKPDPNDPSEVIPEPLFNSEAPFLIVLGVFAIQTVTFELSALLATSYSPELTLDERKQNGYIADSFASNNASQLIFTIIMTGVSLALGLNSYQSGTVGGFVCALYCLTLFFYGYPKLGNRREVNPNLDSRWLGLLHLRDTIVVGVTKYPDVFIFLCSWATLAATASSAVTLATSYLQFHLNFEPLEVQVLLSIALIMSVPGAILARILTKSFGLSLKRVYVGAGLILMISFVLAPFALISDPVAPTENSTLSIFGRCDTPEEDDVVSVEARPGTIFIAAGFIVVWGLCIGVVYPLNTALFSLLIPGGEESTYFGIKVTFSKCLNWLPPLLFTVINESGSLQYAIVPLGVLAGIGALTATFINMDRGLDAVEKTLHLRRGGGKVKSLALQDRISSSLDDKVQV